MTIIQVDNFEVGGINHDKVDRDNAPQQLTDGLNIRFSKGSCNSSGYFQKVTNTDLDIIPYGLFKWSEITDIGANNYTIYYSDRKAYRASGGTHVDITGAADYGGLPVPTWSGGTFGGLHITNHDSGFEVPRWYNPATEEMEELPGFPSGLSCKVVRFFKDFMFILNLNDTSLDPGDRRLPFSLRWSDLTDPGTIPDFTLAVDSLAGERPFIETAGEIVDGIQLGDEFLVFKEDSTYAMRLTGNINSVFASERRFDRGMLHVGLRGEIPGKRVIFIGRDNVYVTDGRSAQSIIYGSNRDYLFNDIDADNYRSMRMMVNAKQSEVWIMYPSNGNVACNRGAIWNWTNNTWTFIDLPGVTSALYDVFLGEDTVKKWEDYTTETWDTVTDVYAGANLSAIQKDILLGAEDQNLWLGDADISDSIVGQNRFIERRELTIQGDSVDLSSVKFIRSIYPKIDVLGFQGRSYAIVLYVGAQNETGDEIDWQGPFTLLTNLQIGGLTQRQLSKINCRLTGRYLSWRLESTGAVDWRMTGLSADIDVISRH